MNYKFTSRRQCLILFLISSSLGRADFGIHNQIVGIDTPTVSGPSIDTTTVLERTLKSLKTNGDVINWRVLASQKNWYLIRELNKSENIKNKKKENEQKSLWERVLERKPEPIDAEFLNSFFIFQFCLSGEEKNAAEGLFFEMLLEKPALVMDTLDSVLLDLNTTRDADKLACLENDDKKHPNVYDVFSIPLQDVPSELAAPAEMNSSALLKSHEAYSQWKAKASPEVKNRLSHLIQIIDDNSTDVFGLKKNNKKKN